MGEQNTYIPWDRVEKAREAAFSFINSLDALNKLLKRNTPVMPRAEELDDKVVLVCPVCRREIGLGLYCPWCGQRLGIDKRQIL